jgi:hypothetical protein
MAIDKKLFYASHGLEYPVVARPYTDDMEVKEKFYTKDEVIAMLKELQDELKHTNLSGLWKPNYAEGFNDSVATSVKKIQEKIDKLKESV